MLDIQGKALKPEQAIAWARTTGGTLATGVIVAVDEGHMVEARPEWGIRSYHTGARVRVQLASNGRLMWLPYDHQKYVVLRDPEDIAIKYACTTLYEQVGRYVLRFPPGHLFNIDEVRAGLCKPFAEAHLVHNALLAHVLDGHLLAAELAYNYYRPEPRE